MLEAKRDMGSKFAGIDIGSRSIELVVIDGEGKILTCLQADTGFNPMDEAQRLLGGTEYDHIMATGYGRNLFEISFDASTVTEIKAHACGARALFPNAKAVLDIGGQDSKAIALADTGKVMKFEMNDRCAAGTGKFMEVMAKSLGYAIDDFGREALLAEDDLAISSMCTVFAESEVTSLIAKGKDRRQIALGLHSSVIRRVTGMINRISSTGPLVFTGGVAKNPCMQQLLAKSLSREILIPEQPQYVGAMGAAILSRDLLLQTVN